MQHYYIEIENVQDGMFSNEKIVSVRVSGQGRTMIVDESDLFKNMLRVSVLEQSGKDALINLPREPFAGSGRLTVPMQLLRTA